MVESEKPFLKAGINFNILETDLDFNVIFQRCHWTVDPAVNFIQGEITSYFKPIAPMIDSILFNLTDTLSVDSVIYHNNSISFVHSGNILLVHLPAGVPQNTPDSVSIFYQGVPPNSGFGSFIQSSHNGSPIIWTLSEPYGASDWWPCKNSLTDKIDSLDVIITTPSEYRAASNGILVSETEAAGKKTFFWKHRYPIAPYLVCFAVTNYALYSDKVPFAGDTLQILNLVYPEDSANAASQTPQLIPVMQLYDSLFGIYPFQNEKYGHAQFGWGGGMEHQTMTFVSGFSFELLAHELAHHWFGDKITCGSWRDIWLNEGFATYLSGLCYEHLLPQWWEPFKKGKITNIASQPDGSVWCSDTTDVSRIFNSRLTYYKGAMILHQLRWIIGDSAFFGALKNYLSDANCSYGFAQTPDLISHFETSSSQNLSWYFNDWYTGEGYPSYQIDWSQTGNIVTFSVNQSQSNSSIPFFELPLPVKLKNQNEDTIIRLENTFNGQLFNVTIPFFADSLIFDPDFWLISNNNIITSVNETEHRGQWKIFPNPSGEKIRIEFTRLIENCSVKIYDITGRCVEEISFEWVKNISLNIDHLPDGIYSISLLSGKNILHKKFIKAS